MRHLRSQTEARFRALTLFILFFLTIPVWAGTVTLTLEDAVKLALDQSLSLKKGAIDLAQTEYSASRLWSEIFPGFSLSAGLTFLPSTPLVANPGFSYDTDRLSYSLNLGVSLSLNPSFKPSMKRIELAYRSQLLSYENASRQLEIQVIKNFLSLITRKENIAVMEESLALAEQKLEQDRIARQHGLLSEMSLLNSMFSVETARYNLNDASGTYQNALGEFIALLGMDAGTDLVYQGTVDIVPVAFNAEELILQYLPQRPDIVSQRQLIERLELSRDITTSNARSPSLNLSTQWRGGSSSPGGLGAPFSDSISGSLTLTIPVDSWIPGTRQNQNIRASNADVEKAKLDLLNIETAAKAQIRSLVSNLQNAWHSLEIARLRVDIAQHTADTASEGFSKGTVESRDLEDTRKELTDVKQRLLEREYLYQSMLLDLAAALNVDWRSLLRGLQ